MNAARAGRSVAEMAARRAAPSQALSRQVAKKTTKAKGPAAAGAPPPVPHEVVTPPLAKPGAAPKAASGAGKPGVAHETVTPPLAKRVVSHDVLTPGLKPGGGGVGGLGGPPPAKKRSNLLIGAVLVVGVAASYYITIEKMKDQDYLGDAEQEAMEEAQVNLHKSGLKVSNKVVPEQVGEAFNRATEAVSEAAQKVEKTVKSVVQDAKGVARDAKGEASELAHRADQKSSEAAQAAKDEAHGLASSVNEAVDRAFEPEKEGSKKYTLFGGRSDGPAGVAVVTGPGGDAKHDEEAAGLARGVRDKVSSLAHRAQDKISGVAGGHHAEQHEAAHGLPSTVGDAVDQAFEDERPQKKGWRKYIFFGPRS